MGKFCNWVQVLESKKYRFILQTIKIVTIKTIHFKIIFCTKKVILLRLIVILTEKHKGAEFGINRRK